MKYAFNTWAYSSFPRGCLAIRGGLTPKSWTIEKCSSAQVKGAERNEEEIQRGANHRDTERGAGQWSQSNLRQAQHQRGDLLQLEAQVWRDGGSRGAAITCARG